MHGIADDLLGRMDRLGGLKAPHIVFGKIKAQAYDTAAYKLAADAMPVSYTHLDVYKRQLQPWRR